MRRDQKRPGAGNLIFPRRDHKGECLWNKNILLLWQGQFVSAAGDVIYNIALGFIVLKLTGSVALMGTLMALSMFTRIAISPFAGVVVDRTDRKRILIFMDVVRGLMIGVLAFLAFLGIIKIWMLFMAGIGIGICSAFFNPAVSSSIPDIVPQSKLVKANSIFGMIYSMSGIIGNSVGGFLYTMFGPPLIFLMNAFSYFFSAGTLIFMSIPGIINAADSKSGFFEDMKSGLKFVTNFRALKYLLFLASGINFFGNIGYILVLPMFAKFKHLGPPSYGVAMGFFTGGIVLGMLLTSILNIRAAKRFRIFFLAGLGYSLALASVPLFLWLPLIAFYMFVAGTCLAVINVFISTIIQIVVPQEMRGKVFSLQTTLVGSLIPLAYGLGGFIAEFLPLRPIISFSCLMMVFFFIPMPFSANLKKFLNFDPAQDAIEKIQ